MRLEHYSLFSVIKHSNGEIWRKPDYWLHMPANRKFNRNKIFRAVCQTKHEMLTSHGQAMRSQIKKRVKKYLEMRPDSLMYMNSEEDIRLFRSPVCMLNKVAGTLYLSKLLCGINPDALGLVWADIYPKTMALINAWTEVWTPRPRSSGKDAIPMDMLETVLRGLAKVVIDDFLQADGIWYETELYKNRAETKKIWAFVQAVTKFMMCCTSAMRGGLVSKSDKKRRCVLKRGLRILKEIGFQDADVSVGRFKCCVISTGTPRRLDTLTFVV